MRRAKISVDNNFLSGWWPERGLILQTPMPHDIWQRIIILWTLLVHYSWRDIENRYVKLRMTIPAQELRSIRFVNICLLYFLFVLTTSVACADRLEMTKRHIYLMARTGPLLGFISNGNNQWLENNSRYRGIVSTVCLRGTNKGFQLLRSTPRHRHDRKTHMQDLFFDKVFSRGWSFLPQRWIYFALQGHT